MKSLVVLLKGGVRGADAVASKGSKRGSTTVAILPFRQLADLNTQHPLLGFKVLKVCTVPSWRRKK
jgi:hypothetical protein